ncbi:MAG: endonuclease [Candidatus Tectimicrobiota bacterium]|nr:MAG: endonuclease [Candidatus Tectomicrobia bacterium]
MRAGLHVLVWLLGSGLLPAAALAWGPLAHAVIGELAEAYLLRDDPGLQRLLAEMRHPAQREAVRAALLGTHPPGPGKALRTLALWPDWHRGAPGMLPFDSQRHYVNLPAGARYDRARHCPQDLCLVETLLAERARLADPQQPLPRRIVALAWVTHLLGDLHQPLHTGRAADRGGTLTCVTWLGQPSRLVRRDGDLACSGADLHAVWDSLLLEAVTGERRPQAAPDLARALRPLLAPVQAAEPPLAAGTEAQWRALIVRWLSETHALLELQDIYPAGNLIDDCYIRSHYRTLRQQLLKAAVRLAAVLQATLNP